MSAPNNIDYGMYNYGYTNAKPKYINNIVEEYNEYKSNNNNRKLTITEYILQENKNVPISKINIRLISKDEMHPNREQSLESFIKKFSDSYTINYLIDGTLPEIEFPELKQSVEKKEEARIIRKEKMVEYGKVSHMAKMIYRDICTPDISIMPSIKEASEIIHNMLNRKTIPQISSGKRKRILSSLYKIK